jgi:hypothetical protein
MKREPNGPGETLGFHPRGKLLASKELRFSFPSAMWACVWVQRKTGAKRSA